MRFETCAVHCGSDVDESSGAIVKVTFERDGDRG